MSTKSNKQLQNQILQKLERKSKDDIELIDQFYTIAKRITEAEAAYSESLSKLSKKQKSVSKRPLFSLLDSLKSYLEASFNSHSTIKDASLVNQVALKGARNLKSNSNKKTLEFIKSYFQSLHAQYDLVEKLKSLYEKASKDCDHYQKKYETYDGNSITAKIRSTLTSKDNEDRSDSLQQKYKASQRKLDDARNNYLVASIGVQAMQDRLYKLDLDGFFYKLDENFFTIVVESIRKFYAIESHNLGARISSSSVFLQAIKSTNMSIDANLFTHNDESFQPPLSISFSNSGSDRIDEIALDDVTRVVLGQKLVSMKSRINELDAQINAKEIEIKALESLLEQYLLNPSFSEAKSTLEIYIDNKNQLDLWLFERISLSSQSSLLEKGGVVAIAAGTEIKIHRETKSDELIVQAVYGICN